MEDNTKSPSSMSMTLAQGIIKRDMRELKKKGLGLAELYVAMSSSGLTMSGKRRIKLFEELLCNYKGYWYREMVGSQVKRFRYTLWELTNNNELDRIDVKLTNTSLTVEPVAFGLSFHALVRSVYRCNLSGLLEALVECAGNVDTHKLIVSQVAMTDTEKTMRTEHGFLILKMFDDGCVRGVTWVNERQAKGNQLELNADLYSTISGVAESRGVTLHEHLKTVITTGGNIYKSFTTAYVKQGGDITDVDALATYYENRIKDISAKLIHNKELLKEANS